MSFFLISFFLIRSEFFPSFFLMSFFFLTSSGFLPDEPQHILGQDRVLCVQQVL